MWHHLRCNAGCDLHDCHLALYPCISAPLGRRGRTLSDVLVRILGLCNENHLGVEAFVTMLPRAAKCVAIKIMYAITVVIFAVLFVLSCKMFAHYQSMGQVSTIMRIPMCIVYSCVPCGLFISAWHYLVHFIQHLHDKPEPSEEVEKA